MVSDNASNDDTESLVKKMMLNDDRITYYRQEENVGMINNFNFLISKVDTPYFCMLTDDDFYSQNFIYDAMLPFQSDIDVMFSVLDAPQVNEENPSEILSSQLSLWEKEGKYFPGQATKYIANGVMVYKTDDRLFNKEIRII